MPPIEKREPVLTSNHNSARSSSVIEVEENRSNHWKVSSNMLNLAPRQNPRMPSISLLHILCRELANRCQYAVNNNPEWRGYCNINRAVQN